MKRNNKTISIIGEGETEWFYIDSLRTVKRCPFSIKPGLPQHSDIQHLHELAKRASNEGYDYVIVLVDMDRLNRNPSEMNTYRKKKSECESCHNNILFVETNPCTEFWFLLHFLPKGNVKRYSSYDELIPELRKYIPDYEKSCKYLKRINLFKYLSENGSLEVAIENAKYLCKLKRQGQDDIAYSEIYKLFDLLGRLSNK